MSERGIEYVGGSLRDIKTFPTEVKDAVALALLLARDGGKHLHAHPLHGYGGASVVEFAESHHTDAYRVVYTTRFPDVVYVLHAFKKKSKQGREMPPRDEKLIRERLKDAEVLHARRGR